MDIFSSVEETLKTALGILTVVVFHPHAPSREGFVTLIQQALFMPLLVCNTGHLLCACSLLFVHGNYLSLPGNQKNQPTFLRDSNNTLHLILDIGLHITVWGICGWESLKIRSIYHPVGSISHFFLRCLSLSPKENVNFQVLWHRTWARILRNSGQSVSVNGEREGSDHLSSRYHILIALKGKHDRLKHTEARRKEAILYHGHGVWHQMDWGCILAAGWSSSYTWPKPWGLLFFFFLHLISK